MHPDFDAYRQLLRDEPELLVPRSPGSIETLTNPVEVAEAEKVSGDRLAARGLPREWSRVGVVYRDPYVMVLRDAVRFPGGGLGTYIRIVGRPAGAHGAVALVRVAERIVLLRIYRHAIGQWCWELPRGFGEPGETCEMTARREVLEEIGSNATRIQPVGFVHPNTGLLAERVCVVLAWADVLGKAQAEEGIERVRLVTIREFEEMIRDGEITDAFTLGAFALARTQGVI